MSFAHKCDRCGTLYVTQPGAGRIHYYECKGILEGAIVEGFIEEKELTMDLCVECGSALLKFLGPAPGKIAIGHD
jgi:hypothetical protein